MLAEELAEFGRDSLHYGVYGKHVTIFDFYHVPRKKVEDEQTVASAPVPTPPGLVPQPLLAS
jgi:hypothetical protein